MTDEFPQQTNSASLGRTVLEGAGAFVAGTLILLVPVLLDPNRRQYPAAFLPSVRDAAEGLKLYSLVLLVVLGLVLRSVFRSPTAVIAIAAVAVFPIWSLIDVIMGGDHILLPLEWFIYALYGLVVAVGSSLTRSYQKAVAKRNAA